MRKRIERDGKHHVYSSDEDCIEDIAEEKRKEKYYPREVKYIDNKWEFGVLKDASKRWFTQQDKIRFYISRFDEISGKIISKVEETKKRISLIKILRPLLSEQSPTLLFFDERLGKKDANRVMDEFNKDFWMYQLISQGQKYLVLSEDELDLEDYKIKGMIVEVRDYTEIGKNSKLASKIPLLFIHSAKKRIIKFDSHEELITSVRKYNFSEDKLFSWIFSDEQANYLPHPKPFERLISAQLFSANQGLRAYPLHALIIGKTGTGKSTMEDNIYWKYNETNPKTEASGSTFKALIPSFKSIPVQVGALVLANRICMVDEFLRILMDVRPEDREMWFARLNPLLEHQKSNFGSGNANATLQMTAKLIAVSNPVWDTKTMLQLCNRIDTSFLGRLLVWYQDDEHVKMVQDAEEENIKKRKLTIPSELWISIIDYMQTFRAKYDEQEIKRIYSGGMETLRRGENERMKVLEIYKARYKHHIRCLIDGIVKVRCLCSGDIKFEAQKIDYENLEIIWDKMIENWGYQKVSVVKV